MDYSSYLKSTHWLTIRQRIMERAGGVCERAECDRRATQVHHKTYERIGEELPSDLIALCFSCHQAEHPDKDFGGAKKQGGVPCPDCDRLLADVHGLMQHRRDTHNDRSGEENCPRCGPRTFVNGLAHHLKTKHGFRETLDDTIVVRAAEYLPWIHEQGHTRAFLETYGEPWPPTKGWVARVAVRLLEATSREAVSS